MSTDQENSDDYIDIYDIFQKLIRQKKVIIILTSITLVLGLFFSYLISPVYQSTVVISPVEQDRNSGMMSSLGALSQTFGLGGINNSSEDKTALAILKAKPFTNELFKDDDLLRLLFKNRWNEKESKWIDGIRPNDIQINSRFKRGLRIEQNVDTNTIRISVNSEDPVFAAKIANKSIEELNDYMRKKAIRESEDSQKYLNDTLSLTTIMDVKNVIYKLIEEQIKKSMLANVRKEYVFTVIDYASISSSPIRPNRTFILFISTLLGFLLSSIYALVTDNKTPFNDR